MIWKELGFTASPDEGGEILLMTVWQHGCESSREGQSPSVLGVWEQNGKGRTLFAILNSSEEVCDKMKLMLKWLPPPRPYWGFLPWKVFNLILLSNFPYRADDVSDKQELHPRRRFLPTLGAKKRQSKHLPMRWDQADMMELSAKLWAAKDPSPLRWNFNPLQQDKNEESVLLIKIQKWEPCLLRLQKDRLEVGSLFLAKAKKCCHVWR